MLLCLKCFKTYKQKTIKNNTCKIKGCQGEVVEIDELFIPVIAELNKKRYISKYCCSGHICDYPNSYIYFEDDIVLPSFPEGYMYDQDMYPQVNWSKYEITKTIRKEFDNGKSLNELSKDIYNNALSVLDWAEELPELDKDWEDTTI